MLEKLKKHHLGFIVEEKDIKSLEVLYRNKFIYDPIQKTRVLFNYDKYMDLFIEYIVKEGRVQNSPKGYAHTCYSISKNEYSKFNLNLKANNLGFPITQLEKSIANECNKVRFYYYRGLGIIEINVIDK